MWCRLCPQHRKLPERLQPTHAHPCVAGDPASDAYEAPWTCTYKIFGCTDPSFDNYVSFATDSLASMCQLVAGGVVGGVVALCLVAGVAFLIFKKKTTGGSVRSPKAATTVAPE